MTTHPLEPSTETITIIDSTANSTVDETVPINCAQCQQPATFMCSSCGLEGPRYCTPECQQRDWKTSHYATCQSTVLRNQQRFASSTQPLQDQGTLTEHDIILTEVTTQRQQQQQQEEDQEEFADNLKFYMQQIYLIIKPVVVCIVLSIFWVKVGFNDQSDYSPTRPTYDVLSSNNAAASPASDGSGNGGGSAGLSSFANAAIIIGQIIVVTVVIVFFFRKGWIKVLIAFFMLVVMFLLGFMTYLLLLNLIQIFYIPLDYITLSVALWNFVIVGLVSIFWKGPLWLQQAYLTVLSSLMAFSLTGLEQWTTWILLGLLAVWDLIAVLCPFGPLRLLIESSRTQQREVPALLYSVNAVWFMLASPNHFHISHSFNAPTNDDDADTDTLQHPSHTSSTTDRQPTYHMNPTAITTTTSLQSLDSVEHRRYPASTASSSAPLHQRRHSESQQSASTIIYRAATTDPPATHRLSTLSVAEAANIDPDAITMEAGQTETDGSRQRTGDGQGTTVMDEEDTERSGLKLGLGDFVFYSVLVARAAMYDWITTVCCTIAVLTGLTTTIFLLAIFKKALPALPISIAFGILFYFVAKTVLVPYVAAVCVFGMVGV